MKNIPYKVSAYKIAMSSSTMVLDSEDPTEALISGVVQDIGTEVEVTAGGITLHLAAWQDPNHWAEEWENKGIEDPHEFIANLVEEEN